ncbi:GPP34 family phosphoprotein [Rhodococcoides fascians]|uniref:GPP34 family phosphoprotein n=1 Tax=Rhodococcoides fascians TaxID=1828 RepID=UPI00050CC76C|nr:GPP34 family phosphoprotein [Rhodococcus fascians]
MTTNDISTLAVPTALLTLIHTRAGQPFQRFRPETLTAAAELAELIVQGDAEVADGRIVSATATAAGPAWRTDIAARLARTVGNDGIEVRTWLSDRKDAYTVHVDEAHRSGIVETAGKKFLGLFDYRRTLVDQEIRAAVIARLTDRAAADDPRVEALAALVDKADVTSILGLDRAQRQQLKRVAANSSATSIGTSLSSMTFALATVGYVTVIGG